MMAWRAALRYHDAIATYNLNARYASMRVQSRCDYSAAIASVVPICCAADSEQSRDALRQRCSDTEQQCVPPAARSTVTVVPRAFEQR